MKYTIVFMIILSSCVNNQDKVEERADDLSKKMDSSSILKRDHEKDTAVLLQMKHFVSLLYDEGQMLLSFSYPDQHNKKRIVPIGKYHNAFGQPPHETELVRSETDTNIVYALVSTSNIQMGVSSDQINVFELNTSKASVSVVCSFDRIAEYADTSGIDTLSGIKQYDHEIMNIKATAKRKLVLREYIPYKFEDEKKNINFKYKTKLRECLLN